MEDEQITVTSSSVSPKITKSKMKDNKGAKEKAASTTPITKEWKSRIWVKDYPGGRLQAEATEVSKQKSK